MSRRSEALIRGWLLLLWALVLCMVVLGGVTRLTGSGLSIVEWKPVLGVLPPLDEAAWQRELAAYRRSPQFDQVNHWMTLADFKRIYFWEYVHRLAGRLIGLACLLPWLWFVGRGWLAGRRAVRAGSILLLGGLQGAAGWYMVRSGLVHVPRVSHFRLAVHLVLAFGVGQWILWQALDATRSRAASRRARGLWAAAHGLLALLVVQIVYGAFMAGKSAGLLFATFPDMNGAYAPGAFFGGSSLAFDLCESPAAIHWLHRALALVVAGYVAWLGWFVWRRAPWLLGHACAVGACTAVQLVLGALTVLWRVPIALAVAHQAVAYLLLSAAVALCHAVSGHAGGVSGTEAVDRDGGLARAGQDLRRA